MKRYKNVMIMAVIAVIITSCNQSARKEQANATTMENDIIFSKGEKITNNNFTGKAWLNSLVEADSTNPNAVGSVTFEPGARTNWHSHPAGQIILALNGEGYYQEEGSPKKIIHKGDVVKCPPNILHWHGASTDSVFIQVAITSRQNGPTKWMKAVTDEEYMK
jgi:quercetin dioxygenase-like cupin family protein